MERIFIWRIVEAYEGQMEIDDLGEVIRIRLHDCLLISNLFVHRYQDTIQLRYFSDTSKDNGSEDTNKRTAKESNVIPYKDLNIKNLD